MNVEVSCCTHVRHHCCSSYICCSCYIYDQSIVPLIIICAGGCIQSETSVHLSLQRKVHHVRILVATICWWKAVKMMTNFKAIRKFPPDSLKSPQVHPIFSRIYVRQGQRREQFLELHSSVRIALIRKNNNS